MFHSVVDSVSEIIIRWNQREFGLKCTCIRKEMSPQMLPTFQDISRVVESQCQWYTETCQWWFPSPSDVLQQISKGNWLITTCKNIIIFVSGLVQAEMAVQLNNKFSAMLSIKICTHVLKKAQIIRQHFPWHQPVDLFLKLHCKETRYLTQ